MNLLKNGITIIVKHHTRSGAYAILLCILTTIALLQPAAVLAQQTKTSREAPGTSPPTGGKKLPMVDLNYDGKISREEAKGWSLFEKNFDAMDKNKDGFIEKSEITAWRAESAARRLGLDGQKRLYGPSFPATGDMSRGIVLRPGQRFKHRGEFSIITLGSGGTLTTPQFRGPSAVVQYKKRYYVMNTGNGVQAGLLSMGIPLGNIESVLLTDHSIDHTREIIPLLISTWLDQKEPVRLIGPPGTKALYDFFMSFYHAEVASLALQKGVDLGKHKTPVVIELTAERRIDFKDLSVHTAPLTMPGSSIAYRYEAGGKSIVLTTDHTEAETLIRLAHEADILVVEIEKNEKQAADQADRSTPQQTQQSATLKAVGSIAQKAHVKRLVIAHYASGQTYSDEAVNTLKREFSGQILLARDFMEIVP